MKYFKLLISFLTLLFLVNCTADIYKENSEHFSLSKLFSETENAMKTDGANVKGVKEFFENCCLDEKDALKAIEDNGFVINFNKKNLSKAFRNQYSIKDAENQYILASKTNNNIFRDSTYFLSLYLDQKKVSRAIGSVVIKPNTP